jgi:hypothetical protein
MNDRIRELAIKAGLLIETSDGWDVYIDDNLEDFAELIIRECIDKIENYRIPVGNSASGELACEWTYAALKEIRDEIKEHFGVEE